MAIAQAAVAKIIRWNHVFLLNLSDTLLYELNDLAYPS